MVGGHTYEWTEAEAKETAGKEHELEQGIVLVDRDSESHYYDLMLDRTDSWNWIQIKNILFIWI